MRRKLLSAPLILALLLAASGASSQEPKPALPGSTGNGRFVVVFSPHARADTFLLDTQTGRTWQLTKYTDVAGEPVVWQYLTRVDNEADLMKWLEQQQGKLRK